MGGDVGKERGRKEDSQFKSYFCRGGMGAGGSIFYEPMLARVVDTK